MFGTMRYRSIGRLVSNHPTPFFSENGWNRKIELSPFAAC